MHFGSHQQADELAALRQVIRVARSVQAHLLLLAGDVFDHNRQALSLLNQAARVLGDAELPIVILPGNHDPLTPDSVYRRGGLADPSNVKVIGVSVDEYVHFPDIDLGLWGRAHVDYSDMSPLAAPATRSTRWHVVMGHGHFVPGPRDPERFQGSWLILDEEIAATGADYVALGHWNRAAQVGEHPVPAYYSGSPDLARTVNVVRFRPNGAVRVTLEPVPPDEDGQSDIP